MEASVRGNPFTGSCHDTGGYAASGSNVDCSCEKFLLPNRHGGHAADPSTRSRPAFDEQCFPSRMKADEILWNRLIYRKRLAPLYTCFDLLNPVRISNVGIEPCANCARYKTPLDRFYENAQDRIVIFTGTQRTVECVCQFFSAGFALQTGLRHHDCPSIALLLRLDSSFYLRPQPLAGNDLDPIVSDVEPCSLQFLDNEVDL